MMNKNNIKIGHLDYGEEPSQCCLRELKEETGIIGISAKLLTVRGEPNRDPRGHTIGIIYNVVVPDNVQPKADDDAATA